MNEVPTLLLLVGAGVFVYVMRFSPLPALGHQLANEQIVARDASIVDDDVGVFPCPVTPLIRLPGGERADLIHHG